MRSPCRKAIWHLRSAELPNDALISCPVASVLYREGKEDRSWKKEEALRKGKILLIWR
ncbi:hypothetical protein [Okeania sp. SIO2B3]|uniref:hypothetical protein n=1 Tax=Okeania sp. SIO2B3 TaxID=2607784 RepID=UPI0013C0B5B7|nr:hypothetical protein [Okeania sp. SIO2B3]NET46574.1 hypothetical protein [Okeania sp. SIO2B3]